MAVGRFTVVLVVASVLLLLANQAPVSLAQSADTTPPKFESAEISQSGAIRITFTEDIVVSPFVQMVADYKSVPILFFVRAVIDVTVDGRKDLFDRFARISGRSIELRLKGPYIASTQDVRVSYNNEFAVNAGGMFQDAAGNAVPLFGPQVVQNNSTAATTEAVPDAPAFSVTTLTVDEGSTGTTFQVTLPSQPSESQTVHLGFEPGIGTVSPGMMTFDADNWNEPQTATLDITSDGDSFDAWGIVTGYTGAFGAPNPSRRVDFFTVVIEDQDTPLVLSPGSGSSAVTYSENGTAVVDTYNQELGISRRYSLHGPDRAAFSINRFGEPPDREGKLSFASPPDFERPSDANDDNIYEVIVLAEAGGSTGFLNVTVSVTDVEEPPSTPAAPTVSGKAGATDSLNVTWTAPSNSGKPEIEGYDLRYIRSDAGDKADENWTDGPQDQAGLGATITGLEQDTWYDVQVRATNSDGDSPWSVAGKGQTSGVNGPPKFPSSETGTRDIAENTDSGVDIGTPVTATDPEGDTLTYSLGGNDAGFFNIVGSTGQLQTRSDLNYEGRSRYEVEVSVTDGKDASGNADTAEDDSISVTISVTNEEEPGTVTLSSNEPEVDSQLTADLDDPDGNLSSISWKWETSSDQTSWSTISGAVSASYVPRNSDVGKYLRVTAQYTDGHSTGKTAQAHTSHAVKSVPSAPVIQTTTPGDRTLTLAWTDPAANGGSAVTSFDVRYIRSDAPDKGDDHWTVSDGIWASGPLLHTIGALTNGIEYNVQVRAVNAVGEGAWSNSGVGTPRTTPGAPGISSVTPGDRSLVVSWFAPGSDGGAEVAGYELRHIRSDTTDKAEVNWTVTTGIWSSGVLRYGLGGLSNGVEYDLQVRAVNIAGGGDWSGSISGTPRTKPAAPTIDSLDSADESLTLTWSPPTDTGGLNIQMYDLRYIDSSTTDKTDANWTVVDSIWASGTRQYTLGGLANGLGYDLQVRAVTTAGDGPWSPTASGTPQATPGAPVIDWLTPGHSYLVVAWSAPSDTGGATITSYDLRFIRSDAVDRADGRWTVRNDIWNSGNLQHDVSGLRNGIEYDVQMRAVNAMGAGLWSAIVKGTPAAANAAPEFVEGPRVIRSVAENSSRGNNIGAPVEADDADDSTLIYTLGGVDADLFDIGTNSGQIKVGEDTALDYETKADYTVTVSVRDGKDARGIPDSATDDVVNVTITLTDLDEPGAVNFSELDVAVGREITAVLDDPDGGVSGLTWMWERSADPKSGWTNISAADSDSYAPVDADIGFYLRATASYADRHGPGKNVGAVTGFKVETASVLAMFDSDLDKVISKNEVINAKDDYRDSVIDLDTVLRVIRLYFSY